LLSPCAVLLTARSRTSCIMLNRNGERRRPRLAPYLGVGGGGKWGKYSLPLVRLIWL
jgi:hypothetical protein